MLRNLGSGVKKFVPVLIGGIAIASFYGSSGQFAMPSAISAERNSVGTAQQPINPIGQTVPFEGIDWQLSGWQIHGKTISLLPKYPITLRLDGKRLGGVAGCNYYGADYQLQNAQLKVPGPIASTKIGCIPGVAERENWFLTALRSPSITVISNRSRLTLEYRTDAGTKGMMVFTQVRPKLQNTAWQLKSMTTRSTTPSVSKPPITLNFTATQAVGFGGCNDYGASFTEGIRQQLKLGAIGSTKKACPEPQMQFERNFFSQLSTVQRYEINQAGDLRLFFFEKNQSGILTFKRQK